MGVVTLLPVPKFLSFEGIGSFVSLSSLTLQVDSSLGNE